MTKNRWRVKFQVGYNAWKSCSFTNKRDALDYCARMQKLWDMEKRPVPRRIVR